MAYSDRPVIPGRAQQQDTDVEKVLGRLSE